MVYRYRIEGTVQGVAFRYHAEKEARQLGITGTVRNLPDGSVEIFAGSEAGPLKKFEEFLWSGPGRSAVTNVEKEEIPNSPVWTDFRIIF